MAVNRSQPRTSLYRIEEASKLASDPCRKPRMRPVDGACRRRRAARATSAPPRSAEAADEGRRRAEQLSTILVVEDDALLATDLQDLLTDVGYETLWAADAHEAAALLDSHAHRLSALLTDIDLGRGPTGFEVARLARRRRPALPVIYVTGEPSAEVRRSGVRGFAMIPKPFAPDHLLAVLRALIGRLGPCAAVVA